MFRRVVILILLIGGSAVGAAWCWVLVCTRSTTAPAHPRPRVIPMQIDRSHAFWNANLPIDDRVEDLVSRLTLEEKLGQLVSRAPAIERLGIPEYNWWNECLHGAVAPAGYDTTVFPQSIGLAATWNVDLMGHVATAIADETRALHHELADVGWRGRLTGLTMWAPNVNIFRDPRWGRGQETFGEDPYLTGRLGVAYVRGLQGNDSRYLKVVASPKHFAVHSGPELLRHEFDAKVDERDLRETYLPGFRACIQEGAAWSVMCAYNRVNGEPCCGSTTLIRDILRTEWGFNGYVVADCGAIDDMVEGHNVVPTLAEAAATATLAGCDLDCYWKDRGWRQALRQGLLREEHSDRSVKRLFQARFRLGMFDPPERVPFAQIPPEVRGCEAHTALALQAARESIVLLKNADQVLPLSADVRSIGVIGPNADDAHAALLGSYRGMPSRTVTPLEGIEALASPDTTVRFAEGCRRTPKRQTADSDGNAAKRLDEAVQLAREVDVAVLCLGLSSGDGGLEGEQNPHNTAPGFSGGDRLDLQLPSTQQALLRAVHATGTPVALVLLNGGPLAVNWADANCAAILEAWYPGQEGGTAIAEVLFGAYNPAGRLPVTFHRAAAELPPMADYAMAGRTYRFFSGEVLYPFGHGLSYTRFAYRDLIIYPPELQTGETLTVRGTVHNIGDRPGDEVVQLYLKHLDADVAVPIHSLRGFQRIHLQPSEQQTVTFTLAPRQMSFWNEEMVQEVQPGRLAVWMAGRRPGVTDPSSDPTAQVLRGEVRVTGTAKPVD